jgi:hypothetical protein
MKRLSFCLVGLCIALIAGILHVEVYEEFFGRGPPYFGRTTNMDKWSNPVPALAMADGSILFACWIAWRWFNRTRR